MIPPQAFQDADDGSLTNRQLAAMFNVTDRTINRWRRILGTSHPIGRPLTETELNRAKAFLEDGAPYSEVAETLGRSVENIRRRFPGYGTAVSGIVIGRFRKKLEQINPERKSA